MTATAATDRAVLEHTVEEAAPVVDAPRRRPMHVPAWASTTLSAVVVIALWEFAVRAGLAGERVLAAPSDIAGRLFDEWNLYLRNARATVSAAARGYLFANVIALVLGIAAVAFRPLERIVMRVSLAIFCLPLIAIAPVLRVVTPGDGTQVVLAGLATFFTTLIATVLGLRAAPASALDYLDSIGGRRSDAFFRVRLRAAVPSITAGLQIGAPAAFLGALVGEFAGASRGLGILMLQAMGSLDTERIWAVAVVCTVISGIAYLLIGLTGRRLSPWSPTVSLAAATTPPIGPTGRVGRLLGVALQSLFSIAVVGVLWVVALAAADLDSYFAKGPADVTRYLFGTDGSAHRAELLDGLVVTVTNASLGFFAGIVGAVVVAMIVVASPVAERIIMPISIALRSVPILATLPLLIVIFGRGRVGTTVVVAVMSFFPTLVNTTFGLRSAPGDAMEVAESYDARTPFTMWHVRLPAAMPALLASARVAVPVSLLAATVVEWLATGEGLGNLMIAASYRANYNLLWATVVTLTLVAIALYSLVAAVERVVLARVAPEQNA